MANITELQDGITASDDIERIQLIRSLSERKAFLESINPVTWNNADRGGTLDECIGAVSRMLQQVKKIKIFEG